MGDETEKFKPKGFNLRSSTLPGIVNVPVIKMSFIIGNLASC